MGYMLSLQIQSTQTEADVFNYVGSFYFRDPKFRFLIQKFTLLS